MMILNMKSGVDKRINGKGASNALGQLGFSNESGFALVTAIIISVVVFVMISALLYFAMKSTTMSGAGKRYATACQANDGIIEMLKDGIMHLDSLPGGFPVTCQENYDFTWAMGKQNTVCTLNFTVPGLGTTYSAVATVYMAGFGVQPGYRIEFPPRAYAGGGNGISTMYRFDVQVTAPNNTRCDNAALYRNYK
jgi:hypothetical protein